MLMDNAVSDCWGILLLDAKIIPKTWENLAYWIVCSNPDIWYNYSDLYFGITSAGTQCKCGCISVI